MIHEDKYLSPQGKENYKAYKEEQAEKARQRELSRLEHGQRLECKKDIDALRNSMVLFFRGIPQMRS